ncbi:Gas vesicle synthesis protein GvpL/GvpF [Haladaptatus litoreus]|uniref:Gas vesicle synthesis protein GvpL/GvpF n=1 Tax=Haladaptatus litoreus TaxID=553468 RepID=A0A1N6YHS4_9EURY|nr:GvpL/GvpF family gas vesicle protein [Haladaptatus litoreus]SIR14123.1 Gas vesicle synthesis protein GvpL/GvpF [Haladaptatus litoreus]
MTEQVEEFETGRYLYCVVAVDDRDGDSDDSFSMSGIDGEPVTVLTENGVGAVVQGCESPYDTDDLETVRDWLLTHQEVVDTAGQTFGTPLPFRFDTILKGDDERVRAWITDQQDTLERHLAEFEGHWEYRVGVAWDEEQVRDELESEDEELADLRERIDDSEEGTAFLLEKQYDTRIRDLRQARKEALTNRLREELSPLAREFDVLDSSSGVLGDGSSDEVVQVAFLAHEERETNIGEVLDDIAADPGVEVRFTGPWPPYSFAPELEA